MRPSIIFFDEIDGLAPVRSSRQDQIHSSIVSTLLALMDGLDSRGEIVVIGATNRIDAIDPALRRPGRFDREFQFSLPDKNARRSILAIHTREWEPKLLLSFVAELADSCVGYCGADIKALCTEAALFALRRRYPQIYSSSKKLLLDVNSIEVTAKDFQKAMNTIVPASQRSVVSPARALLPHIWPLLKRTVTEAVEILKNVFPPTLVKTVTESSPGRLMANPSSIRHENRTNTATGLSDEEASSDDELGPSIFESTCTSGSSRSERYMRRALQFSNNPSHETVLNHNSSFFTSANGQNRRLSTYRPRLLVCGEQGMGQSAHVAPALLHTMEHLSVYCLDLPALYGVTSKTPEEACAQLFREARRTSPCVVYSPHFDSLWNATGDSLHATLLSLLLDLPPLAPVLFLATADKSWDDLATIMQELFSNEAGQVFLVDHPTSSEIKCFFSNLLLEEAIQPPRAKKAKKDQILEVLPFAPTPPPRQLSEAEVNKARQDEENTMRELRIFLRDVHTKLITDRRFKEFSKPVDLLEVPDYLEVIKEPMDLATILHRIDCHYYNTCAQYLADIDLITNNALKYNPDRDPLDKLIRHRACELGDLAHSHIKSQLEPEFEKTCEEIVAARERRGEKPTAAAPPFVFTAPFTQGIPTVMSDTLPEGRDKAPLEVSDITFVSELQPQSNNATEQKRKSRKPRKKAPIYWGRKPNRRKADAKRNLNADSHMLKAEKDIPQSGGDNEESGTADVTCNLVGDKSAPIDARTGDESNKTVNPNLALYDETQNGKDEDHDINMKEDKMDNCSLLNGDCDLLHSEDPRELYSVMDSDTNTQLISQRRGKNLKNHLITGVTNNVSEEDCPEVNTENIECTGDSNSNTLPEIELDMSSHSAKKGELDKLPDTADIIRSQVADDMKEKLDSLLHLLVDSTKEACIETLERCYSVLQCCLHRHRYCHDKTQLLQDLEHIIREFGVSNRTGRR